MRNFAFLALLLGLAGCATAPQSMYGNFVQDAAQANDKKMADDALKQLVLLYRPASTRFDLQHVTPDFFGGYLVESLRAKGYAVLEFKPEPKAATTATATATASSTSEAVTAPLTPGLSLSYIVDQPKDSGLYRVTLLINRQQSLDRVYRVAQDGALYPAGSWVRKE